MNAVPASSTATDTVVVEHRDAANGVAAVERRLLADQGWRCS